MLVDDDTPPIIKINKGPRSVMRKRANSSTVEFANQTFTNHCTAYAYSDMLARKCSQIIILTRDEFSNLYEFFLTRMIICTDPEKGINLYFITLFIHELNYGIGSTRIINKNEFLVENVLLEQLLPNQTFEIFNILQHNPFEPYVIRRFTLDLFKKITQKLIRNNAQINLKTLEIKKIERTGNYLEILKNFIADNICTISIRFTGFKENYNRLMNVQQNGLIEFDVGELLERKNILSHAMEVRKIKQIKKSPTEYVDTLELFNSWGENWGVKIRTDTGRNINVGYFKIDNDIIPWYIQFVCYLDIVERSTVLKVGKDSMVISHTDNRKGGNKTRQKRNRKQKRKRKQKTKKQKYVKF